jgi:hypothetical protein
MVPNAFMMLLHRNVAVITFQLLFHYVNLSTIQQNPPINYQFALYQRFTPDF